MALGVGRIIVNIIVNYRYCITGLGSIPGQQMFKSKEDKEKALLLNRIYGVIAFVFVAIYVVLYIMIPIYRELASVFLRK
ncbi:hypothetical protein NE686_17850 [Tissierella carlieri]|uniref:Uncharacterized protein n=1 Tax=Tissierella carlieri TaxID=689904 RepID=A0ABT1SER4_9FIRM|nr:hypothetical protein [Tissierella carlieri]MCQ4924969.1 hypothetical protein [Tissierella carlieri]